MNNKDLRELQLYGLDILKEVDRFCKKNKIKYSLGEGTLLGAVRHNGFIPWDDDLDIYMTRENFDKFVTTFKSKDYRVEYFNTMKKYWLPFAKVRMLKETRFSTPKIEKISKYTGPRIDVMPIDNVPEKFSKSQDKQGKMIKFWKIILRNHVYPMSKKPKPYYYLIMIIAKMIPYKFIVKMLTSQMKKYNNLDCNYRVCAVGDYNVRKETFPKEYYEELTTIKFEDGNFPISKYYDKILSSIYGNYMKLPPKKDRFVKHNVIARK